MSNPLDAMAVWAAREPFFLASLLAEYARGKDLDDAGLAADLDCPAGELTMLRLCRAPRTDTDEYWDDVTAIAERFGLDPARLSKVVKRGQVLRRLRGAGLSPGGLLAARDHDEEPPEES
jgi:hypothetical protein